jgi:lipopolysaccharide export system protein LptA
MRDRIPKLGYGGLYFVLLIAAFHLICGFSPQPDARKKRIDLLHAESADYDIRIANATRYIGNVGFKQNNVLLYCDSAYMYNDSNIVNALGHVHIIQADTLHLYGDKIRYDGNSRIAKVNGKVKLINKSIVLTTDEMNFDLRLNIGYYNNWGKIVDTANVLVSKIGRYYSNEDICLFKDSVKVTNKDFVLTADTLKYSTKTERVFLVGPTHIVGTNKRGTLYSEKGWYDTRKNVAELYKSSRIMGKEQSLQGDTIFYSKKEGTGRARSRVLLSDTTNHVAITGRTGVYNERTKIAFVADSAIFMQFSPKDTLFLHADTLKSVPDLTKKEVIKKVEEQLLVAKKHITMKAVAADSSTVSKRGDAKKDSIITKTDITKADTASVKELAEIRKPKIAADSIFAVTDSSKVVAKIKETHTVNPLYRDSVQNVPDTLKSNEANDNKLFMAYHRVRFFKKDLQGLCDSLAYQMKDSVMRLFKDPVLWSDVHQLTGEKIEYRPHKPGPDVARLENNGFIISMEDSIKFNQISGKTLVGYIVNNELKNIDVNGNAITLYYLKNKNIYSGMNKLESSKISVYLLKGKIDSINFFPNPEGKTIPMKELTSDEATLKGFAWRESERPKNRFDLYTNEEKRKKNAGPEKKPASKK